MNQQKAAKKRLGALDYVIILAVLACLIGVGLRFAMVQNSSLGNNVQLEKYVVSFEVLDVRDSSAKNFMSEGTVFYLEETSEVFGTLTGNKTIHDAEKYYEMPNGEIVLATNNSAGDLYRVDVEASVEAYGVVTEDGSFLLNGNQFIGTNKEFKIYSKYVIFEIKIVDITKA